MVREAKFIIMLIYLFSRSGRKAHYGRQSNGLARQVQQV